MGLSISQEESEAVMAARIASERLFLNADKTKVVTADDPEARTLIAAGPGDEIDPDLDVDIPAKYLDKGAAKEVESKEADKPADKAVKKAANK